MNTRQSFEEFHRDNPHVYAELKRLAKMARAAGYQRISIKMLWEVLRWVIGLRTSGTGGFMLNNNHHPRMARLLMQQEPELQGLFELRKRRGEEAKGEDTTGEATAAGQGGAEGRAGRPPGVPHAPQRRAEP